MHHTRLVGGLISLAALLTLLLVPSALLADPATPAPDAPPPETEPAAAGSPTPAPSPVPDAASTARPTAKKPKLTKAQRRAKRVAEKRKRVLKVARKQLGVPYVWGGASRRGFDCSGFTLYVFRSLGRSLPHGATAQARRGKWVSLRHLAIGDLVFYGHAGYYHHVAMYAGGGRVLHAPRRGSVVSYSRLKGAATARRLIGN